METWVGHALAGRAPHHVFETTFRKIGNPGKIQQPAMNAAWKVSSHEHTAGETFHRKTSVIGHTPIRQNPS